MSQAVFGFNANLIKTGRILAEKSDTGFAPYGCTNLELSKDTLVVELSPDGVFEGLHVVEAAEKGSDLYVGFNPVTAKSMSRTGTGAINNPHPLCDAFKYVFKSDCLKENLVFILEQQGIGFDYLLPETEDSESMDQETEQADASDKVTLDSICEDLLKSTFGDGRGYLAYFKQLDAWHNSDYDHPFLAAICNYVQSGSLLLDVFSNSDWFEGFLTVDDVIKSIRKLAGTTVAWQVTGYSDLIPTVENPYCYQNGFLLENWSKYLSSKPSGLVGFDMLTGDDVSLQENGTFSKNVVNFHGNGKYISSNDKSGFTFRGNRISNDGEALSVGSESAYYLQGAMKYIFSGKNSIRSSSKDTCDVLSVWVCNDPDVAVDFGFNDVSDDDMMYDYSEDESGVVFAQAVSDPLRHLSGEDKMSVPDGATVCLAVMGGMTPGRVGVKYFWQGTVDVFAEICRKWSASCSWMLRSKNGTLCFETPSFAKILRCAFGRIGDDGNFLNTGFDNERRIYLLALTDAKLKNKAVPTALIRTLVDRANRLAVYYSSADYLLRTTCAVLRKDYIDKSGKEFSMVLDKNETDRSYLYGRVLAIYDKYERDFLRGAKRPTNALRLQHRFVKRPLETMKELHLKAVGIWHKKVKYASYYESMLVELQSRIYDLYGDDDSPLEPSYLFGYSTQINDFYIKTSNASADNNTSENNETEEIDHGNY